MQITQRKEKHCFKKSFMEKTYLELQDSSWEIGEKFTDRLFFITNKGSRQKEYVAQAVPLLGLNEEQWHALFTKLSQYQKNIDFPFVLKVLQVIYDKEKQNFLVVFDYCEGGTLSALISRAEEYDEILNGIEVLDWLVQMLVALKSLHAINYIHKDICSSNVLLKHNTVRITKVFDLKCLCRHPNLVIKEAVNTENVASNEDHKNKQISLELLTDITSVAPEVLNGEQFTAKADIWAVGCVLFELCSKRKLFSGKTAQQVLQQINFGKFSKGTLKLPAMFPLKMHEVWTRIMKCDPSQRPTAEELLNDPYIAEHHQEMNESIENFAKIDNEVSSGTTMNVQKKFDAPVLARLRYEESLNSGNLDSNEDLELTEEETFRLLHLGSS